MKITTQGNGIKIGTRLEGKIVDKMSKFDRYFGDEGSFNVRIRPEGSRMVVEVTLKLDGKIYSLPCPVSEFTDAGWTIQRDSAGKLGGGNYNAYGMTLVKGDYSIDVGLYNFDDLETYSTN